MLYSVLREFAGRKELVVEINEGLSIGEVLRQELGGVIEEAKARNIDVIVMDNTGRRLDLREKVTSDIVLHVMPPSSGGGAVLVGLVEDADPQEIINKIVSEFTLLAEEGETGAIVLFVGVVRRINRGHTVRELIYEAAREPAEARIRSIADEALAGPGIHGVAIYHYVGRRRPGDVTMIVAIAGKGRRETIEQLRVVVDRVKSEVPIWKKEVRDDGTVYIIGGDREVPAKED